MRWSGWGCAFAALALLVARPVGAADAFPSKPITLVVTTGPGSGSDVLGRVLAQSLGQALGQTIVVENRAGGAGLIGHQSVMRAAPDGYTIVFTSTAALLVVPLINASARYGLSDFVPLASVARAPFAVLVANTPAAPKTLAELTAALRARPQSFASSGVGAMTHLGSELFLNRVGVKAVHVPYKGSGAALTDLIGGQVLFATDSLTAAMPLIKSGKLRALAIAGPNRLASLPDVPSLGELGMTGFDVAVIAGLFAPKGTPREVVERIGAAAAKALESSELRQRFAGLETEPLQVSNEAFVGMLRQEVAVWEPLVRQLDIKAE